MRRHKIPAPADARIYECDCGNTHRSPDANLPVGWSTALGRSWCTDCTQAGIPARQFAAKPAKPAKRRAA